MPTTALQPELKLRSTRKKTLETSKISYARIFLLPLLATLVLVAGWPLVKTIYFSITDAELETISDYSFIGFSNYLEYYDGEWYGILADSLWWRSVWNTFLFTIISVSLETFLGIIVALALNVSFPARGIVRAAILIPWAIPTIVSAKMWAWMLDDQLGIINDLLIRMNILSEGIAWTSNIHTALLTIILVDVWKTTPFMALLILAALQILPKDVFEAAKIDGAGPVRRFFSISLPLIAPALTVAITFRALDALRVFDLIYILTPNNEAVMSMSVYARRQLIEYSKVGHGSAASTVLFLTIGFITLMYLRISRKNFERGM